MIKIKQNPDKEFFPPHPFEANTGRTWKQYISLLRLAEIPSWKDKIIVDLGSSYKPSFGGSVADTFPGAKVIAVDPTFIINGKGAYPIETYNEFQLKDMSQDYDNDVERVIGVAQNLPIVDHSVDFVFSLVAVPVHLPLDHEGRMWSEILRVLRPGGQARIAPFAGKQSNYFAKLLRQYGYEVTQYELPEEAKFNGGVVVSVPVDYTVEEAHQNYEALTTFLRSMNIYAENSQWKTEYFTDPKYSYEQTEPNVTKPIQEDPVP